MSLVSLLPKELHQNDVFFVEIPDQLTVAERQRLTLFYQPIIGGKALSLYFTLWAEGEFQAATPVMHYYLMQTLDMGLRDILSARLALEAIGLMRTWRTTEGEQRTFLYELARPLETQMFFTDPLLSMMLYSKIGERNYRNLRERFTPALKNRAKFTEVTRSFTDVFTPLHSEIPSDIVAPVVATEKKTYPFMQQNFDFALLQSGLQESLVPSAALTAEVKEDIAKLAFLYQLTPIDMQKVVILALDDDLVISQKQLRKAAADYYKLTVTTEMPKLMPVFEKQAMTTTSQTKEEKHLAYLENTSPVEHLRRLHKGAAPSDSAVQLVESLFVRYGLPPGVINVLIEYVMLITDMKLPKKFVESIADQWRRKGINTAAAAMVAAREERDKYQKAKNQVKEPTITSVETTVENGYDNLTPYEFLKQLNDGHEPFEFLVTLAEGLVKNHGMAIGVVNVLMAYAIKETEGKASRNYVETIASNWQSRGITTVEEALAATEPQGHYQPRVTKAHITTQTTHYDTTIPYDFMKACLNGQEPFPTMIALAENLVLTYNMPIGVVNVLVEHVLQKEQGKLPKRLVETIASEWRQASVTTVAEAQAMIMRRQTPKSYEPRITEVQQIDAKYSQPPYVFLRMLYDGQEPLRKDSKLCEDLVLTHHLPVEVANVLIEYVFTRKEGLLPKAYVETIAKRWQLNNVTTVEQALAQTMPKKDYTPTITTAPQASNYYDSSTPYDMLKKLANGQEPFAHDVRVAEELITLYNMPLGVTNVLIEYVYNLQEGQLPKNYINTIAGSWRQKNITTVEQALAHVQAQNEAYEARQKVKRKVTGKVEHVPEWLQNNTTSTITGENYEKERAEILAMLGRKE